jgi:hypothetical protein
MSNDDGRLLVGAILGFGYGLYSFWKGFRDFREFRLVSDTPAIPLRSVPMGLVHVRGEARSEETLYSPVTRTPCYLFQVVVEQWHRDSEGGGEWKNVGADTQSVKFYLQDNSGNVMVDATNAELDLPRIAFREVRSGVMASRGITPAPQSTSLPSQTPASDNELLQYVEQVRLRHVTQMVGRGIGALTHQADSAREPQRQSFLKFMADPTGAGGEGFRAQMLRAMMAKHDTTGETSRAALEMWKYQQGTPEFDAAFAKLSQTYIRAMNHNQGAIDPTVALMMAKQHKAEALTMAAQVASAAEPQTDPQLEQARQTAIAYGRQSFGAMIQHSTGTASGHYRFTEYCLLPGHTYDLTGTCAENPNPRDSYDRNIILKGTNEPTFLISSRTQQQVKSWLQKRAAMRILGGAALAIVCLAYILWKAGLL